MVSAPQHTPTPEIPPFSKLALNNNEKPIKVSVPDGLSPGATYIREEGGDPMMFYNCPYWGFYMFHVFDPWTGDYVRTDVIDEDQLPAVLYQASQSIGDPFNN